MSSVPAAGVCADTRGGNIANARPRTTRFTIHLPRSAIPWHYILEGPAHVLFTARASRSTAARARRTESSLKRSEHMHRHHWRLPCAAQVYRVLVSAGALLLAYTLLGWPVVLAAGQGVTTASIAGVVKDSQGAVTPGATVVAVHEPSGTTYEAVAQADGRFSL